MGERVSINLDRYQLLQEPGMRPPSLRLNYASPSFQKPVVSCFDGILPWLRFNEDGLPYFENRDEHGRETCIIATKATSMADIPRAEVIRMLEGWLRVQTLGRHPEMPAAEATMMCTFLLPDPTIDLRNYRLWEPLPPQKGKRLHILWGYNLKSNTRSAVPAEYAIARLLGVEVDQLAHIALKECHPDVYRSWELALRYSEVP